MHAGKVPRAILLITTGMFMYAAPVCGGYSAPAAQNHLAGEGGGRELGSCAESTMGSRGALQFQRGFFVCPAPLALIFPSHYRHRLTSREMSP
jgi:hypothetical protein